jgi:hypothetical protein
MRSSRSKGYFPGCGKKLLRTSKIMHFTNFYSLSECEHENEVAARFFSRNCSECCGRIVHEQTSKHAERLEIVSPSRRRKAPIARLGKQAIEVRFQSRRSLASLRLQSPDNKPQKVCQNAPEIPLSFVSKPLPSITCHGFSLFCA